MYGRRSSFGALFYYLVFDGMNKYSVPFDLIGEKVNLFGCQQEGERRRISSSGGKKRRAAPIASKRLLSVPMR